MSARWRLRAGAFWSPPAVYLVVGAAAGLLFAVLTPPFQGADEPAHWRRAYQVSEGVLVARRVGDRVGGELPRAVTSLGADPGAAAPLPDARVFVDFRNVAPYPPVAYLPQALAIAGGRALGLSGRALFYAGRLAGLATGVGLTALAIRLTPVARPAFLLLALTPMAIRQMSLITADTVTNAAALLLLALCLRAAWRPGAVPTAQLLLCAATVSLAKIAYLPFAALVLLGGGAPRRRALLLAAPVLLVGGWTWLARDAYAPQHIAPDADPQRQLAVILADPLGYARLLVETALRGGRGYLIGATGYPEARFAWPHLGLVGVLALLGGRADWRLDGRDRCLLAGVAVSTSVAVTTLSYLGWNPVAAPVIEFVQGRYYLPILPLFALLLTNRRLAGVVGERRLTAVAALAGAVSAGIAVRFLIQRWHGV